MIGMTFVIGIVYTFYRFAVDTDGLAGMDDRTFEGIQSLPLLDKALAAGPVTAAGMLSAHHDVSLAAKMLVIVGTIFHRTF